MSQIDGFVLLSDTVVNSGFINLAFFQNTYRIPGASTEPGWLGSGGFMTYGADGSDLSRRMAAYVVRLINGATAAELPIDRAARFSLMFNLGVARNLGLQIPQPVLAQATDVLG